MSRLDAELVTRGIAGSRERAKELIKGANILINGRVCTKPSQEVSETDDIICKGGQLEYVGRGGLKLEKAVKVFSLQLDGLVCMDIGASTGGFTDCMLKNGAEKVFAVDVGHDQLADKLRYDSRVVSMEGRDIRSVSPEDIGGRVDFISIDVSFISLTAVLPAAYELLCDGGYMVALIKPQFEAGRLGLTIGKNGIVKDKKSHIKIIENIISTAVGIGLAVKGIDFSPIKGGKGNTEYLICLQNGGQTAAADASGTVLSAEEFFKRNDA